MPRIEVQFGGQSTLYAYDCPMPVHEGDEVEVPRHSLGDRLGRVVRVNSRYVGPCQQVRRVLTPEQADELRKRIAKQRAVAHELLTRWDHTPS
jgi:hypothetical protein